MAQVIHLHRAAKGRMRPRTFIQTGQPAQIILFTGVRYERKRPVKPVEKTPDRRRKG